MKWKKTNYSKAQVALCLALSLSTFSIVWILSRNGTVLRRSQPDCPVSCQWHSVVLLASPWAPLPLHFFSPPCKRAGSHSINAPPLPCKTVLPEDVHLLFLSLVTALAFFLPLNLSGDVRAPTLRMRRRETQPNSCLTKPMWQTPRAATALPSPPFLPSHLSSSSLVLLTTHCVVLTVPFFPSLLRTRRLSGVLCDGEDLTLRAESLHFHSCSMAPARPLCKHLHRDWQLRGRWSRRRTTECGRAVGRWRDRFFLQASEAEEEQHWETAEYRSCGDGEGGVWKTRWMKEADWLSLPWRDGVRRGMRVDGESGQQQQQWRGRRRRRCGGRWWSRRWPERQEQVSLAEASLRLFAGWAAQLP